MTFLKKLFRWRRSPARIRICVECGMPIAEHKEWCSIYRTLRAFEEKTGGSPQTG
jgi:hypothetical protein